MAIRESDEFRKREGKTAEVRRGINVYSAVIHPGARESSKGT